MEAFGVQAISSSSSSSSSSSTSSPLWVSPAVAVAVADREHMFDKVVTPSDVGKLNRLVIPKQYAERFFPLDPTMADKGLELSFEDRAGKQWCFRYSYWNSSQSYVMTKGWSRFVKEKRLDAGDTVSFFRARDGTSATAEQAPSSAAAAQHRLFIDLQHRKHYPPLAFSQHLSAATTAIGRRIGPRSGLISSSPPPPLFAAAADAGIGRLPCYYYRSMGLPPHVALVQAAAAAGGGDGVVGVPIVLDSVPVILGAAAKPKRVRLFGVNLECPEPPEGSRSTGQFLPSSVQPLLQCTATTTTNGAGADEFIDDISSKNQRLSMLPPPFWTQRRSEKEEPTEEEEEEERTS